MEEKKNIKKNILKKVTYLNIDSRHRDTSPKNLVKSNLQLLDNDPISTTANSNLIKIKYTNHNLKVSDKILIQNIEGSKKILTSSIYLINNFDHILIKFDNHGITSSYLTYNENFKVNIKMISDLTSDDYMIENIPINALLGIQNALLCSNVSTLPTNLHRSLKITETSLEQDYFLVKLPFNFNMTSKKYYWSDPKIETYSSDWPHYHQEKTVYTIPNKYITGTITDLIEDLNDGTINWDNPYAFVEIDSVGYWLTGLEIPNIKVVEKITEITFSNIGNIPVEYLNANYPINYNQYQGYHSITKVEDNYIYFNSKIKAFRTENSGGSKVNVSQILDSITGYPSSNNYTISLKNNFVNVCKIELISVSIPYIDNIIIQNGKNKNNILYWNQYDDGDKIYSIKVPEGDYTENTLKNKIEKLMNNVERVGSTLKDPLYNLFELSLNIKEMNFRVKSYREYNLPNSITAGTLDIGTYTYYSLTILHKGNSVQVGDTILISGSKDVGFIPANKINKKHKVYSVDKSNSSYVIIIYYLNPLDNAADNNTDGTKDGSGGNEIKIRTKSLVRFLFNKPGTIGKLLGFKSVGSENAITIFSDTITNDSDYIFSNNLNQVGIVNTNKNLLKLSYYEKDYFLLLLNDFDTIDNNGSVPSCFAKIFIDSDICQKFVSNCYDIKITTLSELNVKFINPDGSLTDFRNIENSFVLKITENILVNSNTYINSNLEIYDDNTDDDN